MIHCAVPDFRPPFPQYARAVSAAHSDVGDVHFKPRPPFDSEASFRWYLAGLAHPSVAFGGDLTPDQVRFLRRLSPDMPAVTPPSFPPMNSNIQTTRGASPAAAVPEQPSPVIHHMASLVASLQSLHSIVDTLERKLGPALAPSAPTGPSAGKAEERIGCSGLAADLSKAGTEVDLAVARLQEIMGRVEL